MILWLIRYFKGYLDVKFEGAFSEKILSILVSEHITVWNLRYENGSIYGKIFTKDFKKLRKLRRGTGVKIKIIAKHGFGFFARRYKGRLGFFAGAVIFFVILKFLSTFIWVINVEGNTNIKTSQIIKTLKSIGIEECMPASKIDPKNNAQNLLLKRNDLAWASLNIEGSVLNVNVSEIKEKIDEAEDYPSNLLASKDGIIKKIDTVSGDVKIKVGENVHKGDLLVSGIVESMLSTVFVKSGAVITAQVEESYSIRENYVQRLQKKTGKVSNDIVAELFGIKIPLFLARRQKSADIKYSLSQAYIFEKKIPVCIYKKEYTYYETQKTTINDDQLKDILLKKMNEYINEAEIEGYIPIGTEYMSDDEGITIIHRYLADENIATESKIIVA